LSLLHGVTSIKSLLSAIYQKLRNSLQKQSVPWFWLRQHDAVAFNVALTAAHVARINPTSDGSFNHTATSACPT